jgi:NhaA family Na+:H+ antiporter
MSQRMEHLLHPWVTFLIMPVFALANAGVEFHLSALDPFAGSLATGIFLGLVVGKPLGIFLASWLAVKSGMAVLPRDVRWMPLLGVVCLGGVGFTMSIFIDTLAFAGNKTIIDDAKIAILVASGCAALIGYTVINIHRAARKRGRRKFLRRQ